MSSLFFDAYSCPESSLWSEDELLTQMEQMQDQIDQMGREKAELVRVIGEKDTLLEELEQTNSSEISKLQLALQQAQRKLQEQSEQIVTLSGADVILRDNERLKDENARLQKEIDRSEREADRAKEACKARLQKKDDDLAENKTSIAVSFNDSHRYGNACVWRKSIYGHNRCLFFHAGDNGIAYALVLLSDGTPHGGWKKYIFPWGPVP